MALRPGPVNANAARAHLRLAREAPAEAVRALARMARDSPLGEGRPANHLAGGVLRPKEQVERAEAVNASTRAHVFARQRRTRRTRVACNAAAPAQSCSTADARTATAHDGARASSWKA